MGSMKLDLRSAPFNFQQAVELFHNTAFGPSPALYRQVSLCGWRPLIDPRTPACYSSSPFRTNAPHANANPVDIMVYETDDGMTIEVALTHFREDSLHLAISGKRVIIRGERINQDQSKSSMSLQKPRPRFQKLIDLPSTVSSGGFRAQLKGDIVRIDFAKRR